MLFFGRSEELAQNGILAPNAKWRKQAVNYGREIRNDHCEDASLPSTPQDDEESDDSSSAGNSRGYRWAELMRRAFNIDILRCPNCGGRLILLATIEDPKVIQKILDHLNVPTDLPEALPAKHPSDMSDEIEYCYDP